MLGFLWRATRGYRLRPWASPYIKWRIETYGGLHAEALGARDVFRFLFEHWREFLRVARWAGRMSARAKG